MRLPAAMSVVLLLTFKLSLSIADRQLEAERKRDELKEIHAVKLAALEEMYAVERDALSEVYAIKRFALNEMYDEMSRDLLSKLSTSSSQTMHPDDPMDDPSNDPFDAMRRVRLKMQRYGLLNAED